MSDSIREMYQFSVVDYCMFGGMLILSAACGIYYGFFKRSTNTSSSSSECEDEQDHLPEAGVPAKKPTNTFGSATIDEYLLGSRKLKAFPVAMSLLAGYISGVTILGTPAEIYNFGTQYWLIAVPILLMGVAVCTVYLPVFCSLKLNSSYEYLELRFNPYVRSMASVMFVINQVRGGQRARFGITKKTSMTNNYQSFTDAILADGYLRASACLQSRYVVWKTPELSNYYVNLTFHLCYSNRF